MSFDWYNGTIDVKTKASDVLETLYDYLSYTCDEDVRSMTFDMHGHTYELSIREERDKASPDSIERAFQRLTGFISDAIGFLSIGETDNARESMVNAREMAECIANEYWTSWREGR